MEDSEIIALFFQRSEQAITETDLKYGKICKTVALNILANPRDAEECVNDAYLGAWNAIPPQRPSPLLTYLCRIVRNLSIKKYHANTAGKRNGAYDVALEELEDCIPSPRTVDTEYDAKALGRAIDAFLATLNTDNRKLFVRRYWFSEPLCTLAPAFRMTEHNAAVRLSRIRAKLKAYLVKEGILV